MRYRQHLQNKQQNASVLLQQLQLQKQRTEDKLNRIDEDEETDYLLQLQQMTNMNVSLNLSVTPPTIPYIPLSTIAPHTFATIQPKISSGDYIKNKKMNALFNNQTFISCFVNHDNQKVNTKPILTQEEYVLYKDSLSSNCHSNRCDLRYKPYSNGSLNSNLYTYQDLSGVDVIVEAPSPSESTNIYDNYIIDPDQVLFGTQSTSTQKCKKNDTFTKQISRTPEIVNLTAHVSGSCNDVSVKLDWGVFSLQTYYITEYRIYFNDELSYATVKNTTYTFVGLTAGTPDTFTVVAYNNCGDESLPVEITPEYPPSTPEITTITYEIADVDTYDITVNWNPSSYPSYLGNTQETQESVSYHIYYEGQLTPPVVVSGGVFSYQFVGLLAHVPYTFYLYASNTVGSSCLDQKNFIPPFTFTYITTTPNIERTTVIANLPFITSGGDLALLQDNIITTITSVDTSSQVVVNIPQIGLGYTFTDNETTDGLCFNATPGIHNYYFDSNVTSITIDWFGDIPISRGGSQFGYNDTTYPSSFNLPFTIDPVSNTNSPTFLTNTSLNYAFCNLEQFNSFIGFWDTTHIISAIGTFKKCTIFNNGIVQN